MSARKQMMRGLPSGRCPDLCVVVPAYNEEGNIPVLVAELDAAMSSAAIDYHVLFVDDGSQDRTRNVLLELVASNAHVSAVLLSRNFGHQAAVSAGLLHARGRAVAVMDADLQDRPKDVVALYRAWEAGADVAYAVRRSRREGVLLRFLYKAFYRLLSSIANVKIPLDSGDFCVMDGDFVARLNALPERQRYVRGLRAWLGGVQEPVPVDRDSRRSGKPQYTMAALARLALDGFVSFSFVPLRLASYAGGVVSALAFGAMGIVLAWRLLGDLPSGFGLATIALSVLFLGGVQLISIGIIGEYIGRIFDEVKARPVAVVDELRGAVCGWQENEVSARSWRSAAPLSRRPGLCATKAEDSDRVTIK